MPIKPQFDILEDRCVPASVADLGWAGGPIPIADVVDQELVEGVAHTGDGSWRMSNAAYSGMYHGFPNSPGLAVKAGEGQTADMFVYSVWFKAVSAIGDGTSIEVNAGTIDGDRVNKITIVNGWSFGVCIYDGVGASVYQLDVSTWHRLDVAVTFRDGPDTFIMAVDGVWLGEFATFENYFTNRGDADAHAKVVDRVFFRSNVDSPGAAGLYFDDLAYSTRHSSDPDEMLAEYETSFNHGGTPEHHLPVDRPLTKKQLRQEWREQRRELALALVEDSGIRWRKAWRLAGKILRSN